jgi:NitT/TauT family transport system permease protein
MFELRAKLPLQTQVIIGSVVVVTLLALWAGLTSSGVIPPSVLPGPGVFPAALHKMHYEQLMVANALVSLLRITLGFLAAAVIAIPVGILMGAFTPIRAAINPIITPLRFLPIAAVVPIFIFWFGLGEQMKIGLLFLGTVVYLLPVVVEAIDNVDEVYLKTAATLGASRSQIITSILIPAAMPAIYEALRVLYGIGWTYVMLAEFVSDSSSGFGYGGIGYLISNMRRYGTLQDVFVAVILILILGVLVDVFLGWMGRTLFPWAHRAKK